MKIRFEDGMYIKINNKKLFEIDNHMYPEMEIDRVLIVDEDIKLLVRYRIMNIYSVPRFEIQYEYGKTIGLIAKYNEVILNNNNRLALHNDIVNRLLRRNIDTSDIENAIIDIYEYVNNNRPSIHGFFLGGTQDENDKG